MARDAAPTGAAGMDEGHPELVLDRDQHRHLPRPRPAPTWPTWCGPSARLEGLERLRISSIEPGDVDDRLLAGDGRDAGRRAAPARAAAVGRPGGAGGDAAARYAAARLPRRVRPGARGAARPQPHDGRDRRVPGRGRRGVPRTAAGWSRSGDEQGPRLPVLAAARDRRRRAMDGRPPAGERASGPGGCETCPTGSASRTAGGGCGSRDGVLVERRHPDGTAGRPRRRLHALRPARRGRAIPAGWCRCGSRAWPASTWRGRRRERARLPLLPHRRRRDPGRRSSRATTASWPSRTSRPRRRCTCW